MKAIREQMTAARQIAEYARGWNAAQMGRAISRDSTLAESAGYFDATKPVTKELQ
ncbi:hypothetical protein AB4Y36_10130 [Paraburkholderia sp. BR10936]|uniref:hypothetical protein n=1 Tax=Paraburkholderia sp. BR10936 TaxID=3236993 RepID=UPI0034D1AC24